MVREDVQRDLAEARGSRPCDGARDQRSSDAAAASAGADVNRAMCDAGAAARKAAIRDDA